jgi:hypothetical protein
MIPKIIAENEDQKREMYVRLWRLPGAWADAANRHWLCAEALYEKAIVAHDRWQKYIRQKMEERAAAKITSGTRDLTPEEHLLLVEELGYIDEFFLLIGYAVECGLKGCRVAANPSLISDEMKADSSIRSHDLNAHCAGCGITVSDDERKLLEVLTYQIKHGKYPAPTKPIEVPDIRDLFGQREIALGLTSRIGDKLRSLSEFPP